MRLFGFAFVQALIRSVFISQRATKSNKNAKEELQRTCRAVEFQPVWVGLIYCLFIWGVGLMRIILSGSQGAFALLYGCLKVLYLLHYMYPILQQKKVP